jgi:VWFA-related protein
MSKTAKITVLVRSGRDAPAPSLTADDFIVSEHGVRDSVSEVENLLTTTPESPPPVANYPDQTAVPPSQGQVRNSLTVAVHVLLIIAPMSATGRNDALTAAIRFFSKHGSDELKIAILDDEGAYVPFGQSAEQLRAYLHKLTTHVSAPQFIGGPWLRQASKAIGELGIMPGEHALVVVSDYGSNVSDPIGRNPRILQVWPSMFIDSALRAQAAIYAVQSSGPGPVVVPFGGAAEHQMSFGFEQSVADLGIVQGDFLKAAEETGGFAALDLDQAFKQIVADESGYYRITFQPHPDEKDGTWHPVSISVRLTDLRVKGSHYYLAANETNADTEQIPDQIKKAIEANRTLSGLDVSAHAWLFPGAGGVHTGALAADLNWPSKDLPQVPGSFLKVFAQLINDSTGAPVVSWYEEGKWSAKAGQASVFHWQRETSIYPGAYTLHVIGMDSASGKMGSSAYSFLAHPLEEAALRFSGIVISDDCLSANELNASRRNLFDPMLWDGCVFAPAPAISFKSIQNPTVLVRLYPPNEQFAELITKQWKAYAVVDGMENQGQISPLSISPAEVRGLVASGRMMLSKLNLKPGPHQLTVVFEFTANNWKRRQIPLNTEFSIEP